MTDKMRAGTIRPAQMRHLLRATAATSRHPERDELVLLLGLTCAMRITEIARLLVSDVLLPSGMIRPEVSLRADHKGLLPAVRIPDAPVAADG